MILSLRLKFLSAFHSFLLDGVYTVYHVTITSQRRVRRICRGKEKGGALSDAQESRSNKRRAHIPKYEIQTGSHLNRFQVLRYDDIIHVDDGTLFVNQKCACVGTSSVSDLKMIASTLRVMFYSLALTGDRQIHSRISWSTTVFTSI